VTFVPGGLYNTSFVFIMNQGQYNKLSKQDQQAIDALSGDELARRVGKLWDEDDRAGVETMKISNVQTTTASAEFLREVRIRTSTLERAWLADAKALGVDGNKVLAAFRAEMKTAGK